MMAALSSTIGIPEKPGADIDRGGRGTDSSAGKVLALLHAFSGSRSVLGVTELAQIIEVPKSTVHRLLAVMIESGFVCKVGTRYCLTNRLFEVGNRVGSSTVRANGLRRRAMPYLTDLYAGTRETVHLATMCGTDVLYLEKLFGHKGVNCDTNVGTRRPAYATALGKSMMAFLPQDQVDACLGGPIRRFTARTVRSPEELARDLARVRNEGIALDRGEFRPELYCVAAPILHPITGAPIAALSLSSVRPIDLRRHTGRLLEVARQLSPLAAV